MSQRKNKKNRRNGASLDGGDSGGTTKREAAESLVQRAMGEEDSRRRMKLARRALTLDDSRPDAWGILGEAEEDDNKAVRLFREAYRLAEASLGEPARRAIRNEQRGDPALEVRDDPAGLSYLRARAALGLRLAGLASARSSRHGTGMEEVDEEVEEQVEEATDHLIGVLRLDPEDDFGLTHPALSFWLEQEDGESLKAANTIISTHPCDCAHHMFSRTLVYYRRFGGEDYRSRYALAEAIASGPLVPMFLYGDLPMPDDLPSLEQMQEAGYTDALDDGGKALILSAGSAREMIGSWERTPGAQRWLKEMYTLISQGLEEYLGGPGMGSSGAAGSKQQSKSQRISAASDAHGALEGAGVEGLARLLGVPEGEPDSAIEVTDLPDAWRDSRYPGSAYQPHGDASSPSGSANGANKVNEANAENEAGESGNQPGHGPEDPTDLGDWEQSRAGFLFWREREEEDVVLSRFKDSLRDLIEERARRAGLEPQSGTAPFPNSLSPIAGLLGEPEGVSPLSYLVFYGTAGQIAGLTEDLLAERIADFTLITDDPEAAEELRELGAEVFEGPMNET